MNPENENARIIDNEHFSYLLIRDYLLGNILGEHTDEILYWAGKDLARQFPLKSQEDLYEAMIYCGFGQLELLKKEKNTQQYRLESDLITVRTQNEQASFQLEAGFLAQQIQMTTGIPCEAKAEIIVGKDKKKEVLITLFIE